MNTTPDAFAELPVLLNQIVGEEMREPYLSDAEDVIEVRTACAIVRDTVKRSTLRQQGIFGPTEATYHEAYDAIGPVYGKLVPIMEACCTAIAELSDPDTDEIELSFVMDAVVKYLDGLDTTVRETY